MVVAVIGLLSGIVLVSLNNARMKARDAKRLQDVRQLITALSLYYENNGRYPCHSGSNSLQNTFLQPLITSGLMASTPRDPTNTIANEMYYSYQSYRTAVGGPCGQIAHLDISFENPPANGCPSGVMVNPIHCHVFIPAAPSCPGGYVHDACSSALLDDANEW